MDPDAMALFHELADHSPSERAEYFAQHYVPDRIRAEVESLLRFDGTTHAITGYLGAVAAEALQNQADFREGGRCGPYRLVRLVGRGGMGAVYEAEQDSPRRIVALKVINPGFTSPEIVRRFEQESQALGRLQHPGIAQIYEAGTADTGSGPQPYFAMEFIRGQALKEYCESGGLKVRERLDLMARIGEAVHHAHQRGIIHRDLKPGNILVDETGQPKILDFGVARMTDSDAQATRQTDVGQLIGTLAYMSPEQVLADPLELDTRSDVYSLGVILYELLAGRLPYDTNRKLLHEAVRTIREEDPASLGTVSRIYRGDVETIVAKALEKEKGRRYSSAADLAGDIRHYLRDEPVIARPPSAAYQVQKFARRHKALVAGVAAVFVALVAGVIASTWQAARALRAEQTAIEQRDRATGAEQAATNERDRALRAEQTATSQRNRAVAAEERAIQERNRVIAEKQRADTESATAKAINQFLESDLLAQASASTQAGANTKPDPDLKVRTALDRAAGRIAGKFEKQPLVEASIRQTIGGTYRDLGVYPESQRQFERVLELRRGVLGEGAPETLTAMSYVAQLHRVQGRYAQAEALLIRALEIQRRTLGEEHRDTLNSMNSLGVLYREQRKDSLAEPIYAKSLEIRQRLLGAEHPSTLTTMNNLALLYWGQGKNVEAETLLTKSLNVRRRVFGDEHPDTISTMNSLASVHYAQGKYALAEELFVKTVDARRRVLGEEHPNTLLAMQNLGTTYANQGKYEQAEPIQTKTLELHRRVLGEEHPNTLLTLHNLGALYRRQQRYAEAEPLLARALDARRRVNGEEHPQTLACMIEMALVSRGRGNPAQAVALISKVLEVRRRTLGPQHRDTLSSMTDLSEVWLQQRKYIEAEASLREVLTAREKATPDGWERYDVQSLLGASLAGQEKYVPAEPLLHSGYEGLLRSESTIPAGGRVTLEQAGDRIVKLYESWDKPEKAAAWRAKLQTRIPNAPGR